MSFRLARVAGVDVRVHATMLLLFGWILIEHMREQSWDILTEGVLLTLCTFAIITLHELGHVLMARRYGIATRDITLLPVGGVSTFERMPERPREELAIALAGPLVNVAIAALLFATLMLAQLVIDVRVLRLVGGPFVAKLLLINLGLAAFNLLPAFPMDGGRVLRAALATRMGRAAATKLAARIGQVMAIGLATAGLFFAPTLTLVAVFVWFGARDERAVVEVTERLSGLKVADAMVAKFRTLDADTPVCDALELSVGGFQHDFPVRRDGELVGVLTREALLDAMQTDGSSSSVGHAVRGPLTAVDPGTPLVDAMRVMRANGTRAAIVLDHGHVAGLLTAENVAERMTSNVVA